MKTVQDKDGNIIEVADNTPCHASINGALPIMLDAVLDASIFAEMAARDAAHAIEQANYIATLKYKEDRSKAYGSVQDQLDMMYWDGVNGTTTWKTHIATVKATYPKP